MNNINTLQIKGLSGIEEYLAIKSIMTDKYYDEVNSTQLKRWLNVVEMSLKELKLGNYTDIQEAVEYNQETDEEILAMFQDKEEIL